MEEQLEAEKNTVRDFQAKLEITFSGKWSRDTEPYPDRIMSPVTGEYYIVLQKSRSSRETERITFFAVEEYKFRDAGEGRAVFNARVAVHPGDHPIGGPSKGLIDYDKIDIHMPLIRYDYLEDQKVFIENVKIDFLINGEDVGSLVYDEKREVNVRPWWVSFGLQSDRMLSGLRLCE